MNWQARSDGVVGHTNPEELLAAAHSACFSMAFSKAPRRSRACAREPAGHCGRTFQPGEGITGSHLWSARRSPGITEEEFQTIARTPRRTALSRRRSPASRSRSTRAWPRWPPAAASSSRERPAHRNRTRLAAARGRRRRGAARAPRAAGPDEVSWDARTLDPAWSMASTPSSDLSGATVGRIPWTPATAGPCSTRACSRPSRWPRRSSLPSTACRFVSGSAVGFYGDRPGETLTEESSRGAGFFPDLVAAWEAAPRSPPKRPGVVVARSAVVVAKGGGIAPIRLLTQFGLGLGFRARRSVLAVDQPRATRSRRSGT